MKSSPEPGRRAIVLDANVLSRMDSLPRKLGEGEAEGIALCRRLNMVFATHDRQAANFCERAGLRCLHFRTLVDALQKRGLLTPDQARRALE